MKNDFLLNDNNSTRTTDTKAAAAIDDYLEEYFFPQLVKLGIIKDFGVYRTKAEQCKKGDWFVVLNNGETVNFDTKAYLSVLNNFNQTFSLELLTKDRDGTGDYTCGFLLNCDPLLNDDCPDKKQTKYAAIVTSVFSKRDTDGNYIANNNKELYFKKDINKQIDTNIGSLDIILVKVSDIYDMINEMSERSTGNPFDGGELESTAWDIADNFPSTFLNDKFNEQQRKFYDAVPGFSYKDTYGNKRALCYIYDSYGKPKMPEDPLSLVVNRRLYERLPHSWHFTVSDDTVSIQEHTYNGIKYGNLELTNEAMPNDDIYWKKMDRLCNYIEYIRDKNLSKNKEIDKQEKNKENKEFSAPDKDSELVI